MSLNRKNETFLLYKQYQNLLLLEIHLRSFSTIHMHNIFHIRRSVGCNDDVVLITLFFNFIYMFLCMCSII